MYKKVMVALDGSEFSECALEHAKAIAGGCNVTEFILFRAIEQLSNNEVAALSEARTSFYNRGEHETRAPGMNYSDEDYSNHVLAQMGQMRAEADNYLSGLSSRLSKDGVNARGEVVVGKAAESIMDFSQKNNIDLIIMTTHGRSGISRWAFGSVANKVVNQSTVPVLLVSPHGCRLNLG